MDDDLWTALEKISAKDFAVLPVISALAPKKLEGVISRRDIIGAYNKAVLKKSLFK
jgi:CIC family chloride channel protein